MSKNTRTEKSIDNAAKLLVVMTVALLPLTVFSTRAMFTLPKVTVFVLINLVAVALLFYRCIVLGRSLKKPRLFYLVLSFISLAIISAANSRYGHLVLFGRYNAFEGLIVLIEYALAYFFVVQYSWSEKDIRDIGLAAVISAVLVAIVGISQTFGFSPWRTQQGFDYSRAASTLGNPVFLGVYLATVWPLAVGLTKDQSSARRIIGYVGAFFLLAGLILALSRGAWLAWLVASVVLALYDRRLRVAVPAIIIGAMFVGLAASTLLPNFLGGQDLRKMAISTASAESRLRIWRGAVGIIESEPLLGVGPDSFAWSYPENQLDLGTDLGERTSNAHNYYLQLAATLGLPAAAIFIALLIGAVGAALKKEAGGTQRPDFYMGVALIGYFVAMLTGVSVVANTALVWLFIGVIDSKDAKEIQLSRVTSLARGLVFSAVAVFMVGAVLVYASLLYADWNYRYARRLRAIGDVPAAERRFLAAVRFGYGDNPYGRDAAIFYLQKARSQRSKGDLVRGLQLGEAAVRLNPYEAENHQAMSEIYLVAAKAINPAYQRRAEKTARLALNFNPSSAVSYYNLGLIYLKGRRYASAVENLETAADLSPSAKKYFYLGQAHEALGARVKARAAYRRALSLKPGWDEAEDRLRALKG